eukprot:gi/632956709/ref/XP_007894093.1/ PREDICTED: suppressor of tumorigenicity 14 protein-like [Callorhinchus milii]
MFTFPKQRTCEIFSISGAAAEDQGRSVPATGQKYPITVSDKETLPSDQCLNLSSVHSVDPLAFKAKLCPLELSSHRLATTPAISIFYLGGSLEISNLTYTNELGDPRSQQFISQAQAVQNYFADMYQPSILGKYYLKSIITAFSEGEEGLRAYYWSKFSAPKDIVHNIKNATASNIRQINGKKVKVPALNSSEEIWSMEEDFDIYTVELFASGSEEYDLAVKSAISFDLYAKPGNNRTLTLTRPKRSYYQWRLRVPSGHIVRLVILTLHGATPGNCAIHKLSAYDFLLPVQNKIIARWCGMPVTWNPPLIRLTSAGNVMLVTFSSDRPRENAVFKAYFQAIPKGGCGGSFSSWNGSLSSPFYPSYYPPKVDCTWTIRAPAPGYVIALSVFVLETQERSHSSGICDKDWLEIDGVRYCSPVSEGSLSKIHGRFVKIKFHSDQSVTRKGFYLEYRAFSFEDPCPNQFQCKDGSCISLKNHCDGWRDCLDGSDEVKCNCHFNCLNGNCLSQTSLCDGVNDCGDGSDEINCTRAYIYSAVHKGCYLSSYKCRNGKCLNKINPECDGRRDCLDGSDEAGCACGTSPAKKTKIVGGEDARNGEWPWQVSLQMGMYGHICGASIVSNRWLLSAAHCFQDSDSIRYSTSSSWTVYLGLRLMNRMNTRIVTRSIKRITVHSKYNQYTSDYDIALLELNAPVFFSDTIQPICLPAATHVFSNGAHCYVTGWGVLHEDGELATVLQEARVKMIPLSTCNKLYENGVTPRMLCAGYLHGGVDACQGDSGGPLVCLEKGKKWFLAGIVSWGEGCARHNRPGVYTRVSRFRDWIKQHIN